MQISLGVYWKPCSHFKVKGHVNEIANQWVAEIATAAEIEAAILDLLARRAADASICPSEVARALAPESENAWRELMPRVLSIAARMATAGRIRITRGNVELNPQELEGGPVRLRRGASQEIK